MFLKKVFAVLCSATMMIGAMALTAPAANAAGTGCQSVSMGDGQTRTNCVTALSVTRAFTPVTNFVHTNSSSYPVTFSCTSTVSKTFSWNVSATVGFEAGFLFGKVSGSVSGGISKSMATSYSTAGSVTIPAHKVIRCQYGAYVEKFNGTSTSQICAHGTCGTKVIYYFNGTAPNSQGWVISNA